MKLNLLIGAVLLVSFSSCSTAYRSGQTPDDLYYSPGRAQDEYVRVDKKDDKYYDGDDYYEDRYLRMRVQNRYQWSVLDDYYFNSPYSYNYYGGAFLGRSLYDPWNSYHMWNNFYNPYGGLYNGYYGGGIYSGYYGGGYGGHVVVTNPGFRAPARPITFNPSSYSNGNNTRAGSNNARSSSRNYYNNNNNNSRYNNSNTNRGNNYYNNGNSGRNTNSYESQSRSTPERSYNPPASSQSSSGSSRSSSSGSSSGSTRPPR